MGQVLYSKWKFRLTREREFTRLWEVDLLCKEKSLVNRVPRETPQQWYWVGGGLTTTTDGSEGYRGKSVNV